jgi:uncharacterized protein DUF6119
MDEGDYNKLVADQDGYALLDKQNVHTDRFRGGGMEIADALGPHGELVCVKRAAKTAPLNHLFAQGRVAVETLRFDREVREKLLDKIPDYHPVDRTFRAPTVVYGILLKDGQVLTTNSLFAFAKVSLLQAKTAPDGMGARLEIVSIPRSDRGKREMTRSLHHGRPQLPTGHDAGELVRPSDRGACPPNRRPLPSAPAASWTRRRSPCGRSRTPRASPARRARADCRCR